MSGSIFLTLLAVLAVPGPTNSLLFQTGMNRGFNAKSLLWVGAEWLAYMIQITAWGLTLDRVARDYPWVATLSKAFAVCFLFYIAMKLWSMARAAQHVDDAPGLSPTGLFVATLTNPKGLFFASFVAPAGTFLSSADYLAFMSTFTAVVLPVGSAWVIFGACFGSRLSSPRSSRLLNKGVSMVIGLFATGLLYNLASHSFTA
ncbi:LysE family translocator [Pseudomonas capsici]|uniref:LysE family transporter n=1 Tax=Pseudomonas capsici TaxID=2810614 RepID=A0ABT3BRN5_9PSED|nr:MULTISPECIES: LysE family transporter [Pseudomonas]MBN6712900.1 LysE family transporter [Pseudomonas capsici]MBN6717363.1 LysE family transporter [Pseudomonas capsici]MBN6723586.1 LysE family transporter [Pseudomonas capsici]MBX8477985.1 LysE family transporter [Pseudomonas cichorii]MCV4264235.1 LysE family transporter [Pseudomonas capsici]